MNLSAALVFYALILIGCLLPVPVPTSAVHQRPTVVLSNESFNALRPGETTRADVLLSLGEPSSRINGDQFLLYEWAGDYGFVFIGPFGKDAFLTARNYLCLEFGENSVLVRRETFTGSSLGISNSAIIECTKQPQKQKQDWHRPQHDQY